MGMPVNRLETIWPQVEAAEAQVEERKRSWRKKTRLWERGLESVLAEHPKMAIAAAAALGVALGWIVKRK